MDWDLIRQDFPAAKNVTYFQSAAMSPMPNQVLEKVIKAFTIINQYGDIYFPKELVETEQVKEMLAGMLNTTAENLCILPNNSFAMSVLALSFKENVTEPFNIVSMMDEFPSSTVPFEYKGITMKYIEADNSRFSIEKILAATDKNTLAVVTSHVQYCTGFRQDLQKLGKALKERNIHFVVNSTQGFPLFQVDVKACNIDVLTCSIHKWGFAGHVGTIFYTSPEFRKRFKAPMAGWLSVAVEGDDFIHIKKNVPFKLHSSAQQFYTGTYNLHTLMGLKASISYLKNIGFDNIINRLNELGNYLIKKLRDANIQIVSPVDHIEERSAIISITMGDQLNPKLLAFLESKHIHVSYRQGMIRISFNIFNNFEDIDTLIASITEFKNKI
jgi:cysteine desulfurase / selenocysteine lyase